MANLTNERLQCVHKLLSEHRFKIISEWLDDLKCGICKCVLNNAHLTTCGCIYCKKCIDEHKNKEGNFCPGHNEDCRLSDLSEMVVDNRVNRQISQLVMTCDEDGCDFECKLIDMDNHLQKCSKKSVNCPFSTVGCDEKISGDKMNGHLQMGSYIHSKLLMEMLNNLRNDINEIKEDDVRERGNIIESMERNSNEINLLKNADDENKIENEVIKAEVHILKIETKKYEEKLRNDLMEMIKMEVKQSEEKTSAMISISKNLQNEKFELINRDIASIKGKVEEMEAKTITSTTLIETDKESMKNEMKDLKATLVKKNEQTDLLEKEIICLKEEIRKVKKMEDDLQKRTDETHCLMNEKFSKAAIESILNENINSIKMEVKQSEEKTSAMISITNNLQNEKFELINRDIASIKGKLEEMEAKTITSTTLIETDKESMKNEMKDLKATLVKKNKQTDLLEKEIICLKEEIRKVKKMEDDLQKRTDETYRLMNEKFSKADIESILNENINSIKEEMEKREKELKDWKDKGSEEIRSTLIRIQKYLYMRLGVFVWNIGRIDNLRKGHDIDSDFFYGLNNLYKMQLRLSPKLLCILGKMDTVFYIQLLIYRGENDANLKWPFQASVSMKITDIIDANKSKMISQNCVINRSINNNYSESDLFIFKSIDLSAIGLLNNSNCIIECFIDYDK